MEFSIGRNALDAKNGKDTPVTFRSADALNPHILILGTSGSGKSRSIREMVAQCVKSSKGKVRFHVLDVHGDLGMAGASTVDFSRYSPYGINPFVVNPNPNSGGPLPAVLTFIDTLNQASRTPLGIRQEEAIVELAMRVYKNFGFTDNPATWSLNGYDDVLVSSGSDNRIYLNVPFAEKDKARENGARWCPNKKMWYVQSQAYTGAITAFSPAFKARQYPTLTDLLAYADQLREERFLGSDQKALRALGELNKMAKRLHKKKMDAIRHLRREGSKHFDSDEELALDQARRDAIEAHTRYVNAIQTGEELELSEKFEDASILEAISRRFKLLTMMGFFKDNEPPFDEAAPIWHYQLKDITRGEDKRLFVLFTLRDLYYKATQRGIQSDITEVVILDELGALVTSADEKGDGIIGKIAREARKYGLALWAANQDLKNIPPGLITSTATKIVLTLDEGAWADASTKLRIDMKLVKWCAPLQFCAIQMKLKGESSSRWWWTEHKWSD